MNPLFTANRFALSVAALLTAFAVQAQETSTRVDAAQNGGAAAVDLTPKYNAGLNGRVKPVEAKTRSQVAQNGGDTAAAAHAQPKYSAGLGGRPQKTVAQSKDADKTSE